MLGYQHGINCGGRRVRRVTMTERPGWREKAEELGFRFHTMHGEPYWDETSAYAFTMEEIETRIEAPVTELHAMCREAVDRIVNSDALMDRLDIPVPHRDYIIRSWRQSEPELYGRMDLAAAADPSRPVKLLEYNADTPTSLYESAAFQWGWLEDQIAAGALPEGSDQFNGIHEALVERLRSMLPAGADLHFASAAGLEEDYATVEYMAWAAREAGLGAHYTTLGDIGVTGSGQFADGEDRVIGALFKLYPWEDMLRDEFAAHLSRSGCQFIEPPWKALVSNKGILAVLWEMFPDHPNLLPTYFEDGAGALSGLTVSKPLFSREGASIVISDNGVTVETSSRTDYDGHPRIVQAYEPLAEFDGFHPVLGAWVIGEECMGLGIREDRSRITQDLSRFKPHFIE